MEDQEKHMENKDPSTDKKQKRERRERKQRIRLIPIWLRLIIVLFLSVISLVAGLMFGFGVIGEGNPIDAIKPSTWNYIIDIISGNG